MEEALSSHPELSGSRDAIKQGVDRWQLKTQRSGDKNFDKFELYVLNNIFSVPAGLQVAADEAPADEAALDGEIAALMTRLQSALATKRELQRKVSTAANAQAVWEQHRESVTELARSHESDKLESALQGTRQLTETLQQGWQMLRSAEAGAARAEGAPGPRGLQQRFAQRRGQIETVGVPDLQTLSSMLCAG